VRSFVGFFEASFFSPLTHFAFRVWFCYSFSREYRIDSRIEMIKTAQSTDGTVTVDSLNEILITLGDAISS
jgi:hypothetical protein